jgi:hypothetical protein
MLAGRRAAGRCAVVLGGGRGGSDCCRRFWYNLAIALVIRNADKALTRCVDIGAIYYHRRLELLGSLTWLVLFTIDALLTDAATHGFAVSCGSGGINWDWYNLAIALIGRQSLNAENLLTKVR